MNTINWNEELDQAMLVEPTDEHYQFLKKAAWNWITCAIGNQCAIIPRAYNGSPLDFELKIYGADFYFDVSEGDWNNAKDTLFKIEKRSAIIIKKLMKY